MNKKELKRLRKADLLDVIVNQSKEIDGLKKQLQQLREEFEKRDVIVKNAGSIADAVLNINQIFEVAQNTADQYIENVQRVYAPDSILEQEEEFEPIVAVPKDASFFDDESVNLQMSNDNLQDIDFNLSSQLQDDVFMPFGDENSIWMKSQSIDVTEQENNNHAWQPFGDEEPESEEALNYFEQPETQPFTDIQNNKTNAFNTNSLQWPSPLKPIYHKAESVKNETSEIKRNIVKPIKKTKKH